MRECVRRRLLYVATVGSWLVTGHFAAVAIVNPDDYTRRILLICMVAIASCLFTATLFVIFTRPQDAAYRAGVRDGQRASGCSMFRPVLTTVQDRPHATVTSIRVLHTDS